jgi:hypothetical protein
MVCASADLDHASAMTNALTQLRRWLTLARPPLLAGAVAGLAILTIVGWREYWRPNSWLVEGDR